MLRKKIYETILDIGLEQFCTILDNPESAGTYSVLIRQHRNIKGDYMPSQKNINELESELRKLNPNLKIILMNTDKEILEFSTWNMLDDKFPRTVKNLIFSIIGKDVSVWLEIYNVHNNEAIENALKEHLGFAKLNLINCTFIIDNKPLPNICLPIIRKYGPISECELNEYIEKLNDLDISKKWVSRSLDKLRKEKLIYRRKKDKKYILTLKGLRILGTAKNKKSPDIKRVLQLNLKNNSCVNQT